MADDWRKARLDTAMAFLSGGTPSKDRPDYWGGSIPWVSAKDMKQFRLQDTEDHVTEEGVASGTRLVPSGTVLLLVRGMTLLDDVPICIATRHMAFNQDIKALQPRPGVREDFLPYLLLANKARLLSLVDLAGHGTGRLNTDELKALDVLLPPEADQRAVADILGALDNKIELNRRMNETLESIARALFKSWFVDFEPVRAKADGRAPGLPTPLGDQFPARFVDSELGDIPEGWEVRSLDQIAHFLNGLALQKFPPAGGRSLPVIKIAQLRAGNTNGADRATSDLKPDYVIDDGDILFSWSGSLECVLWAGGQGALNQHLFKVTSTTYPRWLCYLGIHEHLDVFRHIAAGKATTMGHIQRHHLSEAKLPIPSVDLLRAMDRVIQPIVDSTWLRHVQSRCLAGLRDTLLPRLVSGELRLKDAEKLIGKAI